MEYLKEALSNLEAKFGAFQELQNNWAVAGKLNRLYDLLKTEMTTRTRTVHNSHELYGRQKYGETSMPVFI